MKRPSRILKLVLFLFIFLIPVCFSDWLYLSKPSPKAALNTDECTVTVHTRTQSNKVEVSKPVPSTKVKNTSMGTRTFSEIKGKWQNSYDKGNWLGTEENTGIVSSYNNDKTIETIVSTFKQEKIEDKNEETVSIGKNQYRYTYTVAWFTWTITTTKKREAPVDSLSSYSIKVKRQDTISPCDLSIDNYKQYSYYSDSKYTTLFDFSKPVTRNTDIYVKYYEGDSALTQFINGKTKGTHSIYDSSRGGSKGQYDVSSDFTYEAGVGCDYLNTATIASGVIINFTYLDNQLYPSPNTGAISDDAAAGHRDSKSNVALDYYDNQYIVNNHCSAMIRLNGDLTVKGTLNIGAKVGGLNSNTHFSEIIGAYAQLDLNGHDLIIDGGTVNCYGSILDRTGGGRILVKNNGTVMGLMTVTDAKGGNQITYGYGKGQSPFDEYRLAYIETPIVAYHGTTIKAYLKLDIGSLGISNIYANIIGPVGSSVFSWGTKKTEDDCMEIIPYINKYLYPSSVANPTNKSTYIMMYYYRYRYNFKANVILNSRIPLEATINVKGFSKNIAIDWARIGVPIPSFFDLKLYDEYSLTLKAKLLLLPGSSFVTMKRSNLIFDPGEKVLYDDLKIQVNLSIIGIDVDVYIKGEDTRNRGSLMAYDRSFYSYNYDSFNRHNYGLSKETDYWKFTKPSSHMILGNITIEDMPDAYKYLISGPISMSEESVNKLRNSSFVQTYEVKGAQSGSWWFSSSHSTYESSVNMVTSFNALPLISNGKACIKDSKQDLVGTFDEVSRLFTSGNKRYFLWTPNDYLIGGSDPKNQNALTDYTVTPKTVDEVIPNRIIKSEGQYYIFYKGVFVPVKGTITSGTTYQTVNASLRKFCSNNNSPLAGNSPKYDSAKMSYDSTNNRWKFTSFNS